jgi:hypothetical protein
MEVLERECAKQAEPSRVNETPGSIPLKQEGCRRSRAIADQCACT